MPTGLIVIRVRLGRNFRDSPNWDTRHEALDKVISITSLHEATFRTCDLDHVEPIVNVARKGQVMHGGFLRLVAHPMLPVR